METPSVEENGFYAKYDSKETLGTGVSSVVRRCIRKDSGKEYAVKFIDKTSDKSEAVKGIDIESQVRAEIATLGELSGHPFIISLVDVFETPAFFYLVFELAEGGELFDLLTANVTLSEGTSRRMIHQMLTAVEYMHARNIVHRDLKPENILLDVDRKNVVISDFGFAVKLQSGQKLTELCGTPGYLAPEVLRCSMYDDALGYGQEVDLWACGVIMYTMLVGFSPFWHRKQVIMLRNIMEGQYSMTSPEWNDIGNGPKDLISRLLVTDPSRRLTAGQALAHPWFNGVEMAERQPKCRKRFKAIVSTIITMKHLYYTYHIRHTPITVETFLQQPYSFKQVRKGIDATAFKLYGHWVKRSNDQVQNRAALFRNSAARTTESPKPNSMENSGGVSCNVHYNYQPGMRWGR